MQGKIKFVFLFLLPGSLASCDNRSMNGIDDGLTVIGIIIAIMAGAYYLIKKIWINTKKRS
ncbi:MAG: hypothetical protein Q8941_14805 [Bacteroidota bacterium]|nr:hypothetical protein [Bacteroidota bacterium]